MSAKVRATPLTLIVMPLITRKEAPPMTNTDQPALDIFEPTCPKCSKITGHFDIKVSDGFVSHFSWGYCDQHQTACPLSRCPSSDGRDQTEEEQRGIWAQLGNYEISASSVLVSVFWVAVAEGVPKGQALRIASLAEVNADLIEESRYIESKLRARQYREDHPDDAYFPRDDDVIESKTRARQYSDDPGDDVPF